MTTFEIIITILCSLLLALGGIIIYLICKKSFQAVDTSAINSAIGSSLSSVSSNICTSVEATNKLYTKEIDVKLDELYKQMRELNEQNTKGYMELSEKLNKSLSEVSTSVREENEKGIKNLNSKFDEFSKSMLEKYALIEKSVEKALSDLRRENSEKLLAIQNTVDEKLQKTLDDRLKASFDNVISQIGNVNNAIGEIKNLAGGVDSLKTALTNVKAKGVVGEVILGNIISEVLLPSQYDTNVKTKKGSNALVEYAIKMPAGENDEFIYLPLDAKFPLESYNKIKDAIDAGDKALLDEARKELKQKIRTFAKDISTKYIDVPNTTDFAVMFLPTEGLYIEVIESGLFEEIQREYKINIVGPSTLFAFLNALRQGFNSLAIQKRSSEVFKLLEAVKAEFETFAKSLDSVSSKVEQAGAEINRLITTRSNVMRRKLKDITSDLSISEAEKILEIEE